MFLTPLVFTFMSTFFENTHTELQVEISQIILEVNFKMSCYILFIFKTLVEINYWQQNVEEKINYTHKVKF